MEQNHNSLKDLIGFFGTSDRPVSPAEFKKFWESCTEDQKAYYKSAPLN